MSRSVFFIYMAFLFVFSLQAKSVSAINMPSPSFITKSYVEISAGYLTLEWTSLESEVAYEVQKAEKDTFLDASMIYRGENDKLFISGLKNGKYYYRIRAVTEGGKTSGWSKPLTLRVTHHSSGRAAILFLLGFLVFTAIVLVIIKGNKLTEKEGT